MGGINASHRHKYHKHALLTQVTSSYVTTCNTLMHSQNGATFSLRGVGVTMVLTRHTEVTIHGAAVNKIFIYL